MILGTILLFALPMELGIEMEQQAVHIDHLALLAVILLIIHMVLRGHYLTLSFQDRMLVLVDSTLTTASHIVLTCHQNSTWVQVTLMSLLDQELTLDRYPMKDIMGPLSQTFTVPLTEKLP